MINRHFLSFISIIRLLFWLIWISPVEELYLSGFRPWNIKGMILLIIGFSFLHTVVSLRRLSFLWSTRVVDRDGCSLECVICRYDESSLEWASTAKSSSWRCVFLDDGLTMDPTLLPYLRQCPELSRVDPVANTSCFTSSMSLLRTRGVFIGNNSTPVSSVVPCNHFECFTSSRLLRFEGFWLSNPDMSSWTSRGIVCGKWNVLVDTFRKVDLTHSASKGGIPVNIA